MPKGVPKSGLNRGWFKVGNAPAFSPSHRENISRALTGRVVTEEWRANMSIAQTGKRLSQETRRRIGQHFLGELNQNWKGGVSKRNKTERNLFMETIAYKDWRKAVFERDNFTCQECGAAGARLHADHIKRYSDYPDLRTEITNGRTLCVACHKRTSTWGRPKKKHD